MKKLERATIMPKDLILLSDLIDRDFATIEQQNVGDSVIEKLSRSIFGVSFKTLRKKDNRLYREIMTS